MSEFETFKRKGRSSKRSPAQPCSRSDLHTDGQPKDYLAWHVWAERMSETHTQHRCPGCGQWAIWTPKVVDD